MKTLILALTAFTFFSCASNNDMAAQTAPMMNGQEVNLKTLVTNSDNKIVTLKEITKSKPSVLVFYRGGWCPYCNKQLARLRKITKKISKLGYNLIAVSPDKVSKFSETIKKHKLNYTLISDSNLNLADHMHLSFKLDDKTLAIYKTYGINLEEASGKKHHSLPLPAVYVIDSKGLVHFNYVNPNYKVRLNEKILLHALKELKLK